MDKARWGEQILRGCIPEAYLQGDRPLIVNFSGGKDSLVCLLLALKVTDNVECMYMDAGFELPSTLPYVRERCKEFGLRLHVSHPERDRVKHRTIPDQVVNLVDYIRYYGYFPSKANRWCSIWCKQRPGRVYIRKVWGKEPLYKLVGVRQFDSAHRAVVYGPRGAAKYGGRYSRPDNEMIGCTLVYPILDWTTPEIWLYLMRNGIEMHEGYKLFGVSGCKWCPVHKPHTVAKIARALPGIYDDLLEAEHDIGKPAWQHERVWLKDVVGR
jgi:phosphoadenosine phosphosulfate reductase